MCSEAGNGPQARLKFGSDGFRGVLAREVTFDNLSRIAWALFRFLTETNASPEIIIGYDRRFLARELAGNIALVWEGFGGGALVTACPVTSPLLAWLTKRGGHSMGVMITASHNPPEFLGLKLKDASGGSASPEVQERVSALSNEAPSTQGAFDPRYAHSREIEPLSEYADAVEGAFERLKGGIPGLDIIVDHMHGSTAEVVPGVFDRLSINARHLRRERDPTFGGVGPEPLPERLEGLAAGVREAGGNAVGFAFDGDGDRLTVVDEEGAFVGNHEIFTLFLRHLVTRKGARGRAVGSVSFSSMVERAAAELGVPYNQVPVGFKSVSAEFRGGGVILGGEESGGTAFGFWLPERDALVMALLLLEIRLAEGKSLRELRRELRGRYGELYFGRRDLTLAAKADYERLDEVLRAAGVLEGEIAGLDVTGVDSADGRKILLGGGAWVLIRLSGTEPLLRLYAESGSRETTDEILEATERFLSPLLL